MRVQSEKNVELRNFQLSETPQTILFDHFSSIWHFGKNSPHFGPWGSGYPKTRSSSHVNHVLSSRPAADTARGGRCARTHAPTRRTTKSERAHRASAPGERPCRSFSLGRGAGARFDFVRVPGGGGQLRGPRKGRDGPPPATAGVQAAEGPRPVADVLVARRLDRSRAQALRPRAGAHRQRRRRRRRRRASEPVAPLAA